MAILYSVVSRHKTILSRYAACIGNFGEITDLVLSKLDSETNTKMTYQSGPYNYHYVIQDGVVFLCITDEDFDRGVAFHFLNQIQSKYVNMFGPLDGPRTDKAIPFGLNAEFGPILSEEMKNANKMNSKKNHLGLDEEDNKVERLRDEVQHVKDIMVANIDSIVSRGERLELLVDKTESLSNESVSFRQSSRRVERKMWWQNTKMKLVLVLVVIIVIYAIVSGSCGGLLWPNCVGHASGNHSGY